MKLGISNIAWNENETIEVYKLMKKYGFDGLEIAPSKIFPKSPYSTSIKELNEFKSYVKENNLHLISMQSILYNQNNLSVFDINTTNATKSYIKSCIDFSYHIDCNVIVFGSPKNRIYTDKKNYLDFSKEFFREVGKYANLYNIKFCIEANPKQYNTNFINNLDEQLKFINDCNQEGLGIHIDLGAMILNHENFNTLGDLVDKIDHIHLSLPFLEQINKDNINIFKDLKSILNGYKNYISIEMKNDTTKNIDNIEIALDCVGSIFRV